MQQPEEPARATVYQLRREPSLQRLLPTIPPRVRNEEAWLQ
jgi:hypothetical protein